MIIGWVSWTMFPRYCPPWMILWYMVDTWILCKHQGEFPTSTWVTQAEKSENSHAFEECISGIQQAACEALNPIESLWGHGLCWNPLPLLLAALQYPWLVSPLLWSLSGWHCPWVSFSTSTSSVLVLSDQAVTLHLLDPSTRSWLGKGLTSWYLAEEFSENLLSE